MGVFSGCLLRVLDEVNLFLVTKPRELVEKTQNFSRLSAGQPFTCYWMHPVHWCYGCLCDFELQDFVPDCKMTSESLFNLPLNTYIILLSIGLFILMLSLIYCCYLFRLRRQGTRDNYGYNEVVLKGAGKKLSLLGQTCAVCLEEFRSRDELGVCPCSHAFHKKCLLKWLEIRNVCPMCNKSVCRIQHEPQQTPEQPHSLSEV